MTKKTFVAVFTILVASLAFVGCHNKNMSETNSSNDYEAIASFVPSTVSLEKIDEFFRRNNIEYRAEGSRAYQISVPPGLARKATELLKTSEFKDKLTIYSK